MAHFPKNESKTFKMFVNTKYQSWKIKVIKCHLWENNFSDKIWISICFRYVERLALSYFEEEEQ